MGERGGERELVKNFLVTLSYRFQTEYDYRQKNNDHRTLWTEKQNVHNGHWWVSKRERGRPPVDRRLLAGVTIPPLSIIEKPLSLWHTHREREREKKKRIGHLWFHRRVSIVQSHNRTSMVKVRVSTQNIRSKMDLIGFNPIDERFKILQGITGDCNWLRLIRESSTVNHR